MENGLDKFEVYKDLTERRADDLEGMGRLAAQLQVTVATIERLLAGKLLDDSDYSEENLNRQLLRKTNDLGRILNGINKVLKSACPGTSCSVCFYKYAALCRGHKESAVTSLLEKTYLFKSPIHRAQYNLMQITRGLVNENLDLGSDEINRENIAHFIKAFRKYLIRLSYNLNFISQIGTEKNQELMLYTQELLAFPDKKRIR